ncbi:helix-turn-helix domain-containing protein [Hoeflea sp.]|uniref:helix-turn-helix domain-containing protein n=1 Tax=Hoeflea sp. TaxID=1940281 RepID=UPI003B521103
MSIFVTSQVWKSAPVKGSDLLVLLALSDFANDDGVCWPSMATIAEKARISERSAQRACRAMADSGLIEIEENSGPKGANRYRIILDAAPRDGGEPAGKGGAKLSPPAEGEGGDKSGARGVTNATGGGDTGVTRTVIEPSIEPSRERVRASADDAGAKEGEREGEKTAPAEKTDAGTVPGTADFEKRVMRFCQGDGYQGGEWPKFSGSSFSHIVRRFGDLDEDDRQAAERWRDAFLAKAKQQGVKTPMPVANYLRDRAWRLLTETEMARAMAAKDRSGDGKSGAADTLKPEGWAVSMGPAWSALVFDTLLRGPEHPEHAPGDGAVWLAGTVRRAWPRLAGLFQLAQANRGFVAPEKHRALKDAVEFVPDGTTVWHAWRDEFARRGWPDLPRREGMDGLYMPRGGPEGIAAFEQALAGQSQKTDSGKRDVRDSEAQALSASKNEAAE